jgi:hypothetical protein
MIATLWVGGPMGSQESQGASPEGRNARIGTALEILSHLSSGRDLLHRAQDFWKLPRTDDLKNVFKWGRASKTDAVLTRHFNSATGQETRERQVTIYLRESQPLDDLVLDIAHELVHATTRPAWDPYDPSLTAGKYIFAAIEGEGGEVEAVAAECRVGFELMDRYGAVGTSTERCEGYLAVSKTEPKAEARPNIDRELIRRDFYRVGKWNEEISKHLGGERSLFPMLSREAPALFSSTGNAPYPVALYREFEEITNIACQNSRKRVDAGPSRAPAALQKSTATFLARRCESALPDPR